jgi:hypothetical protein
MPTIPSMFAPTLFLATFETVRKPYDGDGIFREQVITAHTRLVEATDETDAIAKVEREYERHGIPGDDSVTVMDLEVTEVLR